MEAPEIQAEKRVASEGKVGLIRDGSHNGTLTNIPAGGGKQRCHGGGQTMGEYPEQVCRTIVAEFRLDRAQYRVQNYTEL